MGYKLLIKKYFEILLFLYYKSSKAIKNSSKSTHRKFRTELARCGVKAMDDSDESFLERIISNITDSGGGELIEYYDYDEDKVKKLLTDSFKKGGNEELIKELENHNFFIV